MWNRPQSDRCQLHRLNLECTNICSYNGLVYCNQKVSVPSRNCEEQNYTARFNFKNFKNKKNMIISHQFSFLQRNSDYLHPRILKEFADDLINPDELSWRNSGEWVKSLFTEIKQIPLSSEEDPAYPIHHSNIDSGGRF